MSRARLLVAGVGNIFLGDDAFGVEVVRRLQAEPLAPGVEVVDFGIRALDLAFALTEVEAAIVVDAVGRGGAPGTLYVIEPEPPGDQAGWEPHTLTPEGALSWTRRANAPRWLRVVGCEPVTFGPEGVGIEGLSPPVAAAVNEAVAIVRTLVTERLSRA